MYKHMYQKEGLASFDNKCVIHTNLPEYRCFQLNVGYLANLCMVPLQTGYLNANIDPLLYDLDLPRSRT